MSTADYQVTGRPKSQKRMFRGDDFFLRENENQKMQDITVIFN